MSTVSVNTITSKSGGPVNFPNGISIGAGGNFDNVNYIGLAGQQGFGVGICPALPTGFTLMSGTKDIASDNYGNYQYSDGSVMCWVPAFYYKIGTGSNGLAVNIVSIKGVDDYADVATANAAGYALHRMFYNSGAIKLGVFVDKYLCSNNGGIASSVKNGSPLSSAADHNPFAGLTGAPANAYYGVIAAVKTRGASFFVNTRFIGVGLALLSLAHGQAATSATSCAWRDATGVKNYPKGCNNNALGSVDDAMLSFVSDGYSNCAKTGSANFFSKTTHNGQNCGIADLNGILWEIQPGITSDGTNFYLLKTSADMAAVTAGNTLATDLWGATGIAALYDNIGATYGALTASGSTKYFGSTGQVLSDAVSGNAWAAAGAGIPLAGGVGGTNNFGSDALWDYRTNDQCPVAGGDWGYGEGAGVWALYLGYARGFSSYAVGFRVALYL